jgi:hypothetical protein
MGKVLRHLPFLLGFDLSSAQDTGDPMTIETYKLTASQLATLLQVLGTLVLDYIDNPKKPMAPDLKPLAQTKLEWKDLPGLQDAIKTCVSGGDKMQVLYELGAELKDAIPVFHRNRDYSAGEIAMLKALRSYLSTDSETALNFIRKNASLFGPKLAARFLPPVEKSDHAALARTVKSITGRENSKHLTQEESQFAKETSPKLHDKYVDLRKAHNTEFKALLTQFVRESGSKLVPYQKAYDFAIDNGFTHSLVPGFTGKIDDQGRWYTDGGELITGVPNLSTYTKVVMNDGEDPDAQWEFKAVKRDGAVAYGYTANFKRSQALHKYEKVAGLMQNIDAIRKKWLQPVLHFDITKKDSVAAVVLEILYSFAARVGSDPGRGVGTLLVKNASITTQGVSLLYLGKDSIRTRHHIKSSTNAASAAVVEALKLLIEGKTPSSFIFTAEPSEGKFVKVTPADVNAAFHKFGAPAGVSVHKLRTCRATALWFQLMEKDAKRKPPLTEKEALARYKEMTEQVGKLLNHKRGVDSDTETVTGLTAALSYIDAGAQVDLFDRWGFRPPAALEKLLKAGDDL